MTENTSKHYVINNVQIDTVIFADDEILMGSKEDEIKRAGQKVQLKYIPVLKPRLWLSEAMITLGQNGNE